MVLQLAKSLSRSIENFYWNGDDTLGHTYYMPDGSILKYYTFKGIIGSIWFGGVKDLFQKFIQERELSNYEKDCL